MRSSAPMQLQFDEVLDPDRLTPAFDAAISRNPNQRGERTGAKICSQAQRIGALRSPEDQIMQRGICSPVSTCAALVQALYHFGFAEASCQAQPVVSESSAAKFVIVKASSTAIDRDGLPFDGQIRISDVVQEDAVFVLHHHGHGVIDVDVFAPEAAIAQVAVFGFTIDVKFDVALILCNVPIKFALL